MSSDPEDDVMDPAEALEDDLFGSDGEDEAPKARELSDQELDSGDDEGRSDRAAAKENEADFVGHREARILETVVWRHPLPNPVGGEFNNLRLPKFLAIEPRAFDLDTFELPTADHHSNTKSANFSASATANSTIRYRKNTLTGALESNAVLYTWSDGSTTISVGDEHYEMQTKQLAPPRDKPYLEVQDSHSYVTSPSMVSQLLVVVGHLANQYTVRPNKNLEDDALEKLQRSLAAATRGSKLGAEDSKSGPQIIANTQDPEMQKKRAEIAEKERMKLQRRRETAAEKALQPTGARRRDGGLSVDDLEGRGRRPQASGRKPPRKRPNRPDYDSDDDDLPRGRNREDEYDKDDGFLADSDEELEEGSADDDDELESEVEQPRKKKQKTTVHEDELSDADAEAEVDDAPPVASEPRGRKGRNIIEEDSDEE